MPPPLSPVTEDWMPATLLTHGDTMQILQVAYLVSSANFTVSFNICFSIREQRETFPLSEHSALK